MSVWPLPTQSKTSGKPPPREDLVAHDGHVPLRARLHEGLPGLVAGGDHGARPQLTRQRGLVAPLDLRDDLSLEARRAQRPDGAQGDGAAPQHQRRAVAPGAHAQHRVHPHGQRLHEGRRVVVQRVGDREELALVDHHALAPPAREVGVVADGGAPGQPAAPHLQLPLLALALARAREPLGAGAALTVPPEAPVGARDHRVHRHALPRLDRAHRRTHLQHAGHHLVAQHGGEGPEGLHGRARLEGERAHVGAADARLEDLQAHPVGTRKGGLGAGAQGEPAGRPEDEGLGESPEGLPHEEARDGDVEGDGAHGPRGQARGPKSPLPGASGSSER